MGFLKSKWAASKFQEKIKNTKVESKLGDGAVWTDSTPLRSKVIPIGAWDMDATQTVSVVTNLPLIKIRFVAVSIKSDAVDAWHFAKPWQGVVLDEVYYAVGENNIQIGRKAGGYYDGVAYDDTSINRGFVTIFYID